MQHDGLSTSMGGLWRNLDAMATTDPAGGFRTAEYTRSALNRRIHLVGYRKRYFVMQLGLGLRLLDQGGSGLREGAMGGGPNLLGMQARMGGRSSGGRPKPDHKIGPLTLL